MGRGQLYEVQQGQVPGPALWSQQPHVMLQALERVAGKLPSGKESGGVGRQLAEHKPAVCPGGQEGQQHRITESQNHRIVGVGRDLCGSSSPTLLPKQGHLQQACTGPCPGGS